MTARFIAESEGHLACGRCSDYSTWCDHIEEFVKANGDAEFLWSEIKSYSKYETDLQVFIPVIPTRNLYAKCIVRLDRSSSSKDAMFYLWLEHLSVGSLKQIGMVGEGEGRIVFRQMVQDYWFGHVEAGQLRCNNSGHTFSHQNKLNADLIKPDTDVDKRAQLWCMWYEETCLSCKIEIASLNLDDLVPDVSLSANKTWASNHKAQRRR